MKRSPFFVKWSTYVAVWTALALIFGSQNFLVLRFEQRKGYFVSKIIGQWLLHFYLWALLCLIAWALLRRFPLEKATRKLDLFVHLFASIVLSLLQLVLFMVMAPLIGLGPSSKTFTFGYWLHFSLYNDLHTNVLTYWIFIGIWLAADYYRELRVREVRNSQLEAQLANARLQVLKMQLDPHFLFNTMNSISSLMRHDVEAADAMLIGLSDLLRMSLDNVGKQEIPLRDEMEFLEGYLDIQQIRFRERLTVIVKVDPELLDALIPNMITQPLVENAIKHGIAPHSTLGKIEVGVARQGEDVRVQIFNDGENLPKNGVAFPPRGVGLSNTRSRLEVLYGSAHTFNIEGLPQGGVLATIIFPYRTAAESVKEIIGDEVAHANTRADRR